MDIENLEYLLVPRYITLKGDTEPRLLFVCISLSDRTLIALGNTKEEAMDGLAQAAIAKYGNNKTVWDEQPNLN